jgi:hypothetical protein
VIDTGRVDAISPNLATGALDRSQKGRLFSTN